MGKIIFMKCDNDFLVEVECRYTCLNSQNPCVAVEEIHLVANNQWKRPKIFNLNHAHFSSFVTEV